MEVPFSVTFQAHGMVAVGQYNLAIHFHAYSTFFLSFSIYIRTLPMFLIISPSIPLHAYCFLRFIFCISNTSLKLQYRGINYRWPQQVLDISKIEGNKLHKLTTLNPKFQVCWTQDITIKLSYACFSFMGRHGGCAIHVNLKHKVHWLGQPYPWLEMNQDRNKKKSHVKKHNHNLVN